MTSNVYIPSNIGIGLLGISYPLGSDYEEDGTRGTHHLMEHLMCKSFDHLLPKLKRLGVNYNASTGNDRLIFHFNGLDESLRVVAQELYGIITSGTYTWTEEDFNNEKSTVLQEYEDRFNEQVIGTMTNAFRRHYNYFSPIGLRADIENFSYKESLKFREHFKTPKLLCQVGEKNIIIPEGDVPTIDSTNPIFGTYDAPLEVIPKKKKFLGIFGAEGKTVVGLIGKNIIHRSEINRIGMVLSCLNDGIESPLLQEIRDKNGLSYFSYGFVFPMFDFGAVSFLSCTSNRNAKRLRDVYNKFLSGDLRRHISKERFDDCYMGVMVSKKMGEKLPHNGAWETVLSPSPYEGLDGFTYQDALDLLEKHFRPESFAEIEY